MSDEYNDNGQYGSPLKVGGIAPYGLPNPYGSAQDTRTEDVTQTHDLPDDTDTETPAEYEYEVKEARPETETPRFEPRKQLFNFLTTVGVDGNIDIPFSAQSVRIDNLSSQWVFILQLRRWVPPYWYGSIYNITGLKSITLIFQSPPGITQPTAVANGLVIGTAHQDYIPEVDGEGLNGTGGITASGFVQGMASDGTAAIGNPVQIGAVDGGGLIQAILSSVAGRPQVALGASAGAFSAIAGFPITVQDNTDIQRLLGALALNFNGATSDAVRTPIIFKTAILTALGSSAVWTPAAGKKFRLMRFKIDLTGQATLAAAANLEITFLDAATALNIGTSVFVPNAAVANAFGAFTTGWIDLGNGALSSTINNILNGNLSVALATGEIRISTAGTEE